MKQTFCILVVVVVLAGAAPAWAQVKVVENTAPLTDKQKAVLSIVEKLPEMFAQSDRKGLAALMDNPGTAQKVTDTKGLYSCVLFDTGCMRSFLNEEAKKRQAGKDTRGAASLAALSETVLSARDFFQKNRTQMQVTFQPTTLQAIQVELHGPRRPNAAHTPPAFGTYESLTLNFVQTDTGWKINLLFPELFSMLTQALQ